MKKTPLSFGFGLKFFIPLAVLMPISSALAAFSCDSGSLSTTCYVSTVQTLSDTETISGSGNLIIQNGGELTTAYNATTYHYDSFVINISGDLTVQDGGKITGNVDITANNVTVAGDGGNGGGRIDVSGKGYSGGNDSHKNGYGPGAGLNSNTGSGGAYGGNGGNSLYSVGGLSYGSIVGPLNLGSGGAAGGSGSLGGHGGGLVKLSVNSVLTINGSILASGGSYSVQAHTGGGSGGSIWIDAGVIQGAGIIFANGGNGAGAYGGGGGGGRISLYYDNDDSSIIKTIHGGNGYKYGGAGTIYKKDKFSDSTNLTIDNNGTGVFT